MKCELRSSDEYLSLGGGDVLTRQGSALAVEIQLKKGSVLEGHVSHKRNGQTERSKFL